MSASKFSAFLILVLNNILGLRGNLTISGTQCGQIKCQIGEFCSKFDKICMPCAGICDKSHHNFEESECITSCQDYLHDLRYVRKNGSGSAGDLETLRGEVRQLSQIVSTTLVVVCFMLIVLLAVLIFQLYRWKIKKNITWQNLKSKLFKKTDANSDVRLEDQPEKTNAKPDLRLQISHISTVSDHSPVTSITNISTRTPAEDSALDYAYDNPAMSASPK